MKSYFEEIGAWPSSHSALGVYVAGFALSLLLTLVAYGLVVGGALPYAVLVGALVSLALLQFAVQLVCFLHLRTDEASRERLAILAAAAFIVLILVSGSLWIMFSLSARMMPSAAQMQAYMNEQIGF